MTFPIKKVTRLLHYIPGSGLLYVNNAKVACSTIKKSIWTSHDASSFTSPHDKSKSPFCTKLPELLNVAGEISRASVFTVVRNPYSRILSAYLDKTKVRPDGSRDLAVWTPLRRRFGFDDTAPDFSTFLKVITTEDPGMLDQHFCPQFENVLYPLMSYNFVGRIEEMDKVWKYLAKWKITPEDHRPHSTKPQKSLAEIYGPEEQKIMLDYFEKDFETFGYSEDPSRLEPVRKISASKAKRHTIVQFLRIHGAGSVPQRRELLEELTQTVSQIDATYQKLSAGLISKADFNELLNKSLSGEIKSWPVLTLIAQELLERHRIPDAQQILGLTANEMKTLTDFQSN